MDCKHRPRIGLPSASIALLVCAGLAAAQDQRWETLGSGSDLFGFSIAACGDVNGDGIDDVIAGASHDATNGPYAGAAYVLSGLDGSILLPLHGPVERGFAGASVGGAGDVDADGTPDVIIGAPGDYRMGTPPGAAYVVSGLDGHLIRTFFGNSPSEQFGMAVSGLGDVDLDGYADVAVGAPRRGTVLTGGVTAFSGKTGAVLWQVLGEQVLDYFGNPLCRVGDVNQDGVDDLLVGSSRGYVRMHSGVDGTILYICRRGFASDGFGMSVGTVGDLGYDGVPELIVGAPQGGLGGQVYVLDGRRGDLQYILEGELTFENFGRAVSGAGDLNGDGRRDWLVGAPLGTHDGGVRGAVYAFSGMNGKRLYTWTGKDDESFGYSVAGDLNANGDGFADLVVGAPTFGVTEGRVVLFAGNDLFLAASPRDVSAGDTLTLEATLGTPYRDAAIYLVKIDGVPVFLPVREGSFDQTGVFAFSGVVPPVVSGHTLTFHAFGVHWTGDLIDSSDVVVAIQ